MSGVDAGGGERAPVRRDHGGDSVFDGAVIVGTHYVLLLHSFTLFNFSVAVENEIQMTIF